MPIQSSCARFGLGSVRIVRQSISIANTDSSGVQDAFVTKYDTLGGIQWAARLAGNTGGLSSEFGFAVTVDSGGNIYATGGYSSIPMNVYNADGTLFGTLASFESGSRIDAYIIKYNSTGAVQWTARIGAGGGNDQGRALTTDSSGNLYIIGSYNSTPVSVISSNGTTLINLPNSDPSSSGASSDTFFAKYNSSGIAQWATRFTGTGTSPGRNEVGTGIVVSGTDIYVVGYYNSAINFFNPNNSFSITLAGDGTFIVKYNTDGFLSNAVRITNYSERVGVDLDSSGNIYVASMYSGTPTVFNSGGGTIGTLPAATSNDIYIVKFSTSFSILATFRVSGLGNEVFGSLTIDRTQGSVYVVGQYDSNPASFINADGSSFSGTLANSGAGDVFVVKYNTSGVTQWAARISGSTNDLNPVACLDSNGNLYVSGTYASSPVTVYSANGTTFGTLANSGGDDVFIVKYNTSGVVQWSARMVGTSTDTPNGIAADSAGNVIITGNFSSPTLTIYSAGF